MSAVDRLVRRVTAVDDAIAGCISPEVAVARLLLAGLDTGQIVAAVNEAPAHPAMEAMRHLVVGRARQLDALAAEVSATAAEHDASGPTAADGVARISAFFDRAVRHSPEASVALYSLGDPAILAAATQEAVDWLAGAGLLPPGADVVDLGCGIGRMTAALAPLCRSVLALDVSAGMIDEARRRLARLPNVVVQPTCGEHLDALPPGAFDLVLAVDSFPYVVQTGPAAAPRHVMGAATALRPGGALCILNLSYRENPAQDDADAQDWALAADMRLDVAGARPFRLWDGAAYVFRR